MCVDTLHRETMMMLIIIIIITITINVAVPNTHNLHSTIAEKLQNCTELKEELVKTRQLNTNSVIPIVLSTNFKTNYTRKFKTTQSPPCLYILKQKAVILNTYRVDSKFFGQNIE
jgi:competence protein ComGC